MNKKMTAAAEIYTFLVEQEDKSGVRDDILAAMSEPRYFGHGIAVLRNLFGDEIVTSEAVKGCNETGWRYKLAQDRIEANDYIIRRKMQIRNGAANLIGLCDRTMKQFGPDPETALLKAMLTSIVTIVDASPGSSDRISA